MKKKGLKKRRDPDRNWMGKVKTKWNEFVLTYSFFPLFSPVKKSSYNLLSVSLFYYDCETRSFVRWGRLYKSRNFDVGPSLNWERHRWLRSFSLTLCVVCDFAVDTRTLYDGPLEMEREKCPFRSFIRAQLYVTDDVRCQKQRPRRIGDRKWRTAYY